MFLTDFEEFRKNSPFCLLEVGYFSKIFEFFQKNQYSEFFFSFMNKSDHF